MPAAKRSPKASSEKITPKTPLKSSSARKKPAVVEMSATQKKIFNKMRRSGMSEPQARGLSAYTAQRSEASQAKKAEEQKKLSAKPAARKPRKTAKSGKR